ncbi:MAG TPA: hypothetical protein VLU25_20890 [Acidobacteriota bacterium]|nr:hypothetical protein [Acidobacteriota bacterium]
MAPGPIISKSGPLRRLGYALVASSLVLMLALPMIPFIKRERVGPYAFFAIVGGAGMIAANWMLRQLSLMRLSDKKAYCMNCGWYGEAEEAARFEACPECEKTDHFQIMNR